MMKGVCTNCGASYPMEYMQLLKWRRGPMCERPIGQTDSTSGEPILCGGLVILKESNDENSHVRSQTNTRE
jgi:hypothetical protein